MSSEGNKNAIVEKGAQLGKGVEVGSYSIIYKRSKIGGGSVIEPHSEVGYYSGVSHDLSDPSDLDPSLRDFYLEGQSARIGESSLLRSSSIVYAHTDIGDNFLLGHNSVIAEHSKLGDDVVIGSNSVLNGYTRIGDRTKIYPLVVVPQSTIVGRGVFISPKVSFANTKKATPQEEKKGPKVEDYVRIGVGADILGDVKIGKGALIGAGSVVTDDVEERAIVHGVPAEVYGHIPKSKLKEYVRKLFG